ncbi:hypothetical protein TYRP_014184 [Tyrophagus putrescentiae]|nr:hypothetical protein TYRP_014184 [Tyrophagus putrescentiae]
MTPVNAQQSGGVKEQRTKRGTVEENQVRSATDNQTVSNSDLSQNFGLLFLVLGLLKVSHLLRELEQKLLEVVETLNSGGNNEVVKLVAEVTLGRGGASWLGRRGGYK